MSDKKEHQVLIVEDHPIFSEGLRALIEHEPGLQVCGQADSTQAARKILARCQPDLVVLDLALKDSSGFDLIGEINGRFGKKMPVLVLSMHDETLHAQRCLRAGASGYIMKQEASLSVVTAIRRILKGYLFVSEKVSSRLLESVVKHSASAPYPDSPLDHLSDRELEIFKLIGMGLYPGDIADRLNISVKTVGTYRERLKIKLGLSHGMDLLRAAILWVEQGMPRG
jgi:DNA-binding NarL/FixJ family response regulator